MRSPSKNGSGCLLPVFTIRTAVQSIGAAPEREVDVLDMAVIGLERHQLRD